MDSTRRDWLFGLIGPAALAGIADAQEHARQALTSGQPDKFEFFDPAAAREIAAIARQILPSDDTPGAEEAGVIYFIDRAVATFEADQQDAYREGLRNLHEAGRKLFPTFAGMASLSNQQQIELLSSIEKSEFFELVRTHTLLGFLGNPSYGGNRGKVGWKQIGFEDGMAFTPPFGYYDAEGK
jgi:gluconate 2-dehydrogenase gamma chain